MQKTYLWLIWLKSIVERMCCLRGLFPISTVFVSFPWLWLAICLKCFGTADSRKVSQKSKRVQVPETRWLYISFFWVVDEHPQKIYEWSKSRLAQKPTEWINESLPGIKHGRTGWHWVRVTQHLTRLNKSFSFHAIGMVRVSLLKPVCTYCCRKIFQQKII